MKNYLEFSGKTVLVTGAAAGIGLATVEHFLARGAAVLMIDRDSAELELQSRRLGEKCKMFSCDVASKESTASAFTEILKDHPKIDIAVLNAGIEGKAAPLHEISVDDFDQVMAVNVRGVFLWLSRLMGLMRKTGGGVMTITSSTGGLRGSRNYAPYATSKHALIGLMKTAALEGASFGIRVNTVNPGPIDTRMMRAIAGDKPPDSTHIKYMSQIPLGRYGTVDEIAAMIAFLSGEQASFCTGASYLADGGTMAGSAG